MRTATREQIEQVWDDFCAMGKKESDAVVKQFMNEQPALGGFLAAEEEEFDGDPEDSRSIEIALTAWKVLSAAVGRRLKSVTPEQIEVAEEANLKALEDLEDSSEIEFTGFTRDTLEKYNQRELIGFAVEVLMSGHEESPELAPESIGMQLLSVKTVIDCLDQHG